MSPRRQTADLNEMPRTRSKPQPPGDTRARPDPGNDHFCR